MFIFNFNSKVKDKVTGFTGTITARAEYAYTEPRRYLVEGIDSTGRPVDCWIPEDRLVIYNGD